MQEAVSLIRAWCRAHVFVKRLVGYLLQHQSVSLLGFILAVADVA